jgi:hypothetical protein
MSFLVLVGEEVEVTTEGMCLQSVKNVYVRDRHSAKPWFGAFCKYVYFMYKQDGIFKNMLPEQRAERICSEMLKDKYRAKDFEVIIECKTMINQYINLQYSLTEILYEGLKEDIEGLLKHIKNIPYTKKSVYEGTIDVPGQDGILQKQKVRVPFDIDNSEEKAKAIKLAETMIDYDKKLRTKINDETKEDRKKQSKKRLFEDEE